MTYHAVHFLLLLQEHILLHQVLLQQPSQAQALVNVDRELDFDFLRL